MNNCYRNTFSCAQGVRRILSSSHDAAKKKAGLTLIEVLISMSLGVLVICGALSIYTANQQAARAQSALVEINETGQFAEDFLRSALRRAGSGPRDIDTFPYKTIPSVVWSMTEEADQFDTLTLQYVTGEEGGYTCTGSRAEAHTAYFSQYAVIPFGKDTKLMQLVCRTGPMKKALVGDTALAPPQPVKETGIILSGLEAFAVEFNVFSKVDPTIKGLFTAESVDSSLHIIEGIEIGLLLKNSNGPALFGLSRRFQPIEFNVLNHVIKPVSDGVLKDNRLRQVFEFSVYLEHASVPTF